MKMFLKNFNSSLKIGALLFFCATIFNMPVQAKMYDLMKQQLRATKRSNASSSWLGKASIIASGAIAVYGSMKLCQYALMSLGNLMADNDHIYGARREVSREKVESAVGCLVIGSLLSYASYHVFFNTK